MDGAARRVSLGGMDLLQRGRKLREQRAEVEVARRLHAVRSAALTAERAQDAVAEQRAAWRERESATLLAMQGALTPSNQVAAHWAQMDRLADDSVQLQAESAAADAQQVKAEEAADAARVTLAQAARTSRKGEAMIGRIRAWRSRAAEAAEEIEREDDITRHRPPRPI